MDENEKVVPYTTVKYVGMGEIVIYLVSEDELLIFERGEPTSTLLNLAIFLLSVGLSFFASLLLSEPKSNRVFVVMVVITVVTLVAGIVLAILWNGSRRTLPETIARIRARKVAPDATPVSGEQAN